jgi:hypothetical protein
MATFGRLPGDFLFFGYLQKGKLKKHWLLRDRFI